MPHHNNIKKQTIVMGEIMQRIVLIGALMLAAGLTHAATATRTSSFAYDASTGLLIQEVIEPDTPALKLQTDYSYDSYGNKLSATVSGSGIATRSTSTVYDANGQFPATTTNALGHSDTGTYDARFGKAATLTGPNGLTTTWSYDGFGRKVNETRADGTQTNIEYRLCDSTCPYNAQYYIVTTTAGSPTSYVYYDMLNRKLRAQAQGFDGRLVTQDTEYDSLGRVLRASRPYYAGESIYWSYVTYDQLGRVIQETAPDNSTKQIAYNGLTTTVTNALNQTETKTKNSQGQLVSVTDNLNNVITYQYDPFGNLTKTADPKGNQTTLTYDTRGRKIGMVDPDMGSCTYTYNVLGELIQQRDAKLQIVNMTYDLLGRMLTRSEPDLNSTWVYDTATKGVGKLKQVSSDNGFLRVYTYDSLGRVSSETSTIDTTYNVSKTYDAYGRVSVLTYPTGVAVKNVYNAYGYLAEVRNNASNALFWKGNAKDADGHVLNETLGNGLITTRTYTATTGRVASIAVGPNGSIQNQSFMFDSLGNLIYRYDPAQAQSETFSYDGLNRLITTTKGATTTTVAYDSIGNITNKSDVGDYTYGAKPHAVAQVTGTINATYTYDANGNLTSGAGRTVTYTSYNQPSLITTSTASVSFIFDADHTRIKQISSSETMIYLNPRIDAGMHFEKEVKGGVTEYKHYIYGAAGVVGIYTTSSAASPKTSYFHQDHLGSIVAVTDDAAVVVARYAFDPWGKRILLAGDADATHHGFTGHEHLSDVGLVHMNGRIYDPILARFMSADPYIQAPDNLQSYNRYSYVWNNPLSATDPSGYFKLGKFLKKNAGTIINIAATFMGCPGCGAIISSAYSTIQNKGNFGDFLKGMAINFVAGQIAGPISNGIMGGLGLNAGGFLETVFRGALAGGIGGGLTSMAYGGSFADGFRGGAFSGGITAGIIWGYRDYLYQKSVERFRFESQTDLQNAQDGFPLQGTPAERYTAAGGDINSVKAEARVFAQSPLGQEFFGNLVRSGDTLTVYAETGFGPMAEKNYMYFNGTSRSVDGVRVYGLAFAHELSHTKFGYNYSNAQETSSVGVENRYLAWMGRSLRESQQVYLSNTVNYAPERSLLQKFFNPY